MLKNYFNIALRNLLKNRVLSFINILGLALGISCCLLIFLYVQYETSFDRFHSKSDRIYRVLTIDEALGVTSNLVGITLPAIGPAMQENFPEVEDMARMFGGGRSLLTYEDKNIYSENLFYGTKNFFTLFDFKLKEGDAQTLERPFTAVLTKELAEKTFGSENPIGKSFTLNNNQDYEVVGIMEKPPKTSHLDLDILVSVVPTEQDTNNAQVLSSWGMIAMITYVQLADASQEEEVERKMEQLIRDNGVGDNFKVTLQPLHEAHLGSSDILFDGHNQNKGDKTYVSTLSIIALFVILIAAFNFMNLSTARSTQRAGEVGIRKVLGAVRPQLIGQFLIEASVMALIAMILAVVFVGMAGEWLSLPFEGNPAFTIITSPQMIGGLVGLSILLGVFAGSYPAFLLSSFLPVMVLKGKFTGGGKGVWLRRMLVITQFAASIAMIIGTTIIYQQINHLKNLDKGFDAEQIVTFSLGDQQLQERYDALVDEMEKIPEVLKTATTSSMPGRGFGRNSIRPEGAAEDDVWIVSVMFMDEHYLDLMDMELVAGRNYSEEYSTDGTEAIMINQALADKLGWDDPIGKTISTGGADRQVIGVVKNFHFASMRHEIEPMMMRFNPGAGGTLALRLNTKDLSHTIDQLGAAWAKINPSHPFEYQFFDEEFGQQYESDERFGTLAMAFTWFAVIIACMGLFGLSAFTAELRTKEISMRKILGASVPQIVLLLSREFALLVLIAAVLAIPIAYFGMADWLEGFAYGVPMHWAVFAGSGLLALLIALLTTSYHAIRTAHANPIEALRYE